MRDDSCVHPLPTSACAASRRPNPQREQGHSNSRRSRTHLNSDFSPIHPRFAESAKNTPHVASLTFRVMTDDLHTPERCLPNKRESSPAARTACRPPSTWHPNRCFTRSESSRPQPQWNCPRKVDSGPVLRER
ncbi:hypothetical protein RB11804 [Rhodopirellula baltica SH 1]|uniref:Uncharacterized protein n=1 Tax=Rhodopirellula baltica (strain DSM 10527 / NCIMB 13988 / SH1) TaxID=243090 RepID=Q7UJM2_RHOBA|nr:hypothetical protein RB11804 [Rhodopirellula baltica SH 1]